MTIPPNTASLTKLVFFDLDGTVIRPDNTVSEGSKSALAYLAARGITLSAATGRAYFGASKFALELGLNGPSVFFSGALVIVPGQEKVIYEARMTNQEIESVLELTRQARLCTEIYSRDQYFIEQDEPLAELHATFLGQKAVVEPAKSVLKRESVLKLVILVDRVTQDSALRQIISKLPNLSFGVATVAGREDLLACNVTNRAASRDRVFDEVLSYLKLEPKHVISFGDGESDITFLRRAGLGIAMGNASQIVKNAARWVTLSVEQDGVAHALGEIFGPSRHERQT